MELSTSPPLDILGYIADMLGADNLHVPNWHAVKALKTLSLTCKFMIPICRRHLFAHIVFSPDLKWRQGLNEFLLSHPVIVTHYLKNVSITVTQSTGFSPWYFDLLQKICDSSALHSIGILSIASDWVKYSEQTKTLALSLIQQPTIRHLTLDSIINFPVSALSLCSGLKELSFYDNCSFAPLTADDPPFKSPAVTTLVVMPFQGHNGTFESLLQPIGRNTVIAFHCLKDMNVSIRSQNEFYFVCSILQRAVRLERLKLTVNHMVPLIGLGSSLTANTRSKLKSLTVDLGSDQIENYSPLPLLNLELRQLSGKNVLEVLEVKADKGMTSQCIPGVRGWAADFTRLVKDHGAFPMLRRVTVDTKPHIYKHPDSQ